MFGLFLRENHAQINICEWELKACSVLQPTEKQNQKQGIMRCTASTESIGEAIFLMLGMKAEKIFRFDYL